MPLPEDPPWAFTSWRWDFQDFVGFVIFWIVVVAFYTLRGKIRRPGRDTLDE